MNAVDTLLSALSWLSVELIVLTVLGGYLIMVALLLTVAALRHVWRPQRREDAEEGAYRG